MDRRCVRIDLHRHGHAPFAARGAGVTSELTIVALTEDVRAGAILTHMQARTFDRVQATTVGTHSGFGPIDPGLLVAKARRFQPGQLTGSPTVLYALLLNSLPAVDTSVRRHGKHPRQRKRRAGLDHHLPFSSDHSFKPGQHVCVATLERRSGRIPSRRIRSGFRYGASRPSRMELLHPHG